MQVNDLIRINLIMELGGTAQSTSFYFKVTDATLNTTIEDLLTEFATAYVASIDAWISNQAVWTCALWTNLSGNDPQTASFFVLPGGVAADSLPVDNCVRVKREGFEGADIRRGSICIAGIAETAVERGRVINAGEIESIESFMISPFIAPVAGTILLPGFFAHTAPLETPVFVETGKATTNPIVVSLRRRQTKLCSA